MRLAELKPEFHDEHGSPTKDFSQACGVTFDCPGCVSTLYSHRIWAPFQGIVVGQLRVKFRVAWAASGTGVDDLTFSDSPQGSRSIRVLSGCKSHFNVTNGAIEFYGDSGHTNPRTETMSEPDTPTDQPPAEPTAEQIAEAPATPLVGFVKTLHLRFKGGRLQQRWDHGAGDQEPQWADVPEVV